MSTAEQALTHHVALVLDNDEQHYRYRVALTRRAWAGAEDYLADPDNEGSPLTVDILAKQQLASDLKDFYEDIAVPDNDAEAITLPLLEVFSTALAFVDWEQLAADYLDGLGEEA